MAMTMKNTVFLDVTPCGSCKSLRFGGRYQLYRQGGVRRLLVSVNVVPSSAILVRLMMEKISFSATLVLTRATRHNIPEYGIFHVVRIVFFFCKKAN
jgi:hypothetical protein